MNLHKEKCTVCGGEITPIYSNKDEHYVVGSKRCFEHCDPFDKEHYRLEKHLFYKDTPPIFRETKIEKLPNDSVKSALISIIEKDTASQDSLLLHGTTGSGKSRAAWLIANHWFKANYPRSIEWMSPRKLDSWLIGSFSESMKHHEKCVNRMCAVPLLVIDDLGKERLTPRVESDLFAIIDERVSNKLPTYITTNFNAKLLIDRFPTKETAVALIRRIREHFTSIGTGKETV